MPDDAQPDYSHPGERSSDPASRSSVSALFEELSVELRALAGHLFRHQSHSNLLQPTALINEAWLKMQNSSLAVSDRAHFFALAGRVMRQILTDHARYRHRLKRGGQDSARVTMSVHMIADEGPRVDLLVLNEALEKLEGEDPRIVEAALRATRDGLAQMHVVARPDVFSELADGAAETGRVTV
ncbi:MAG: ECF-type sigma factor, partial [Planctomycetota bacterium]